MAVRLKIAQSGKELDDVFWVRHQVFVIEEGVYHSNEKGRFLVDRFDVHPFCANLIAYEGENPIATLRLNLDSGTGLPPEQFYDFTDYKNQLEATWDTKEKGPLNVGSAGMLAVRNGWRKRRDVIRALFKLAAGVGDNWKGTHILATANHDNALMYERLGFKALREKYWIEDIGNFIVPMAATLETFYERTIGQTLKSIDTLKFFSDHFQRMVFRAGECIFKEGNEANECYVVDSGSVRIIRENPHDKRELALAVLGSGEIFGELALIDDKPRSATAIAATDSEMIALRRDDFVESLRSQPEHLDLVLGFISQRLRRTDQLALLLAFGSPQQRLEFSLMGFLDSAKIVKRKAGVSVLKVGPNDLAAAAGTDIESSLAYLDALRDRRLCTYTDKQIKFIVSEDEYRRGVVF